MCTIACFNVLVPVGDFEQFLEKELSKVRCTYEVAYILTTTYQIISIPVSLAPLSTFHIVTRRAIISQRNSLFFEEGRA